MLNRCDFAVEHVIRVSFASSGERQLLSCPAECFYAEGRVQLVPMTIVVGTGRCGSTMLSRILQMHPDVLSLSEFWNVFRDNGGSLPVRDIPLHEMTGEEYWQRITKCDPYHDSMNIVGLEEYPRGGRFDPATGVPVICRTLAPLTSDFEAVYDKLAASVPSWPRRPMAAQCSALFADLATMLGRRVIVERSGGSAGMVPMLRQQFPEARFVFLHRDGQDSALSMSRHPSFRLILIKMAAEAIGSPSAAEIPLPPEIRAAKPEDLKGVAEPPFDADRFMSYPLPLTSFGWFWSWLTRTGTSDISEVPHDRLMTMRYELILANAHAELTRLAGFIGVPAERRWLDEAAKFVDSGRAGGAATKLHPIALAELRAACASGTRAYELLESRHAAATNSSS
jgi:Sulfotransferase family